MGKLDHKVAVITGAGSGIGQAVALLFASEGARIAVVDFDPAKGQRTVDQIAAHGGEAAPFAVDVRRGDQVEALMKAVVARFGQIDILVNNAAVEIRGSATQLTEDQWDTIMDTNVKGYWLCSKYAIPEMQKAGGDAIVNSASTLSYRAADERAAYCASKGAVLQLTRSMAMDYTKDNIRVNCLVIGPIDTPLLDQSKRDSGNPEAVQDWLLDASLLGRLGEPVEVARVALFLCTPESSFIVGGAVPVDGGMLAH